MAWWNSVPSLTPIAAYDNKSFDEANNRFTDKVGSNHLNWAGSTPTPPTNWLARTGTDIINSLDQIITLPADCTLVILCSASVRAMLFSKNDVALDGVYHEDNNYLYIRGETAGASKQSSTSIGFHAYNFFAFTRDSSGVRGYLNSNMMLNDPSTAPFPTGVGRIGGWRTSNELLYSFRKSDGFVCAGIFAGAASAQDLINLKDQIDVDLGVPLDTSFDYPFTTSYLTITDGASSTIAHNSTQNSIDVTTLGGTFSSFYILRTPRQSVWFEADIQCVSDYSSPQKREAGLMLSMGEGRQSFLFFHCADEWGIRSRDVSGNWLNDKKTQPAGQMTPTSRPGMAPTFNVGDTRTFRLESAVPDNDPYINLSRIEASIDGVLIFEIYQPLYKSFTAGIYALQGTYRIHAVRGNSPAEMANVPIGRTSARLPETKHVLGPPISVNSGSTKVSTFDRDFGGDGVITAKVREIVPGSTNKVPVQRRVVLLVQSSKIPIRETWSDPVTGEYTFTGLNKDITYTILAYDHTGAFTAVAADNIRAA